MHFIRNKCNRKLLMKISALAILLTWFATTIAANSIAQNLASVRASLPSGTLSLREALKQLEQQTDIRFTFVSEDVNHYKQFGADRRNTNVAAILEDLLEETDLEYRQVGTTVVIRKKSVLATDAFEDEAASAQEIRGRVVDENGQPLVGVSIRVKGTTRGTSTDGAGYFTLREEGQPILIISYVGYQTRELAFSQALQEIALAPDFGDLDAVTVIAYGTTSRRTSTGSTASITSEEISRAPVNNVLEALQGQIAGLDISPANGLPGSSFNVRLRGLNSIGASNAPLYIVDGVPYFSESLNMFSGDNGSQSPISGVNPNDIERIDVLKDADATAIYGSRGANGVILITTKKGQAGNTRANFNLYTGAGRVTNMIEMLSTAEYLELRREAYANSGETPDPAAVLDLFEWDQALDQNWQDKLFGGTAKLTEANVSISGGSETTNFLLSGTLRQESTVQPGDNAYSKGSGMLSVNHSSADGKFRATATANYTGDSNDALATDISQYYNLAPNMPIYNEDGTFYWSGNVQNPYAYLQREHETRNNTLLTSGRLAYSPVKNLDLSATIGYNRTDLNQLQMYPSTTFNPSSGLSSMSYLGNGSYSSYSVEPQASYTLQIGKGSLNVLAGATWQQSVRDGNYFVGEGFTSDAQLDNIDLAVSLRSNGMRYSKYRYQAGFARATYNWENKYIINGTFRRDGSSRFGPDRRVGNFGSVGAAWVFSEEEFVKEGNRFLSFGKLRGSYGVTGNDQIGDYGFMDTWSPTSYPYGGLSGLYPTRVANPLYSWESTRKLEVGLELGFLQNRLTLNVNRYLNESDNQLIEQILSPQTGFSGYMANLPGVVQNRGWEFELSSVNVKRGDFEWITSANVTFSSNKLVAYPGLDADPYNKQLYAIGHPMAIVFGYKFTGVDPQTGIAQFADLSGDGELNAEWDDMYVLGSRLPKYFGGLNNSFTYGNLNLSFLFQFVKQEGEMLNFGYSATGALGLASNFDVSMRDRWREPGQVTDIPRAAAVSSDEAYSTYNTYYRHSDALWGDASFIRLKNVMLSYDFTSLVPALKTQRIQLYGQGQNLFTFTNYDGFDPETQGRGLPPLKYYTLGIRFTY